MKNLDIPYRTTILEQILLLTLIICRWLLPREGISRDQLSQLLLVNIGMAADILELFEALKENIVRHHMSLNIIILTLWQASLFQFSLTKTVTKARKVRVGFTEDYSSKSIADSKMGISNCICCRTELWAIATSLLLQDIPFFCLRITLIVDFDVLSYSNIFFTCKNSLVILLQLFRSYVIVSGKTDETQLDSAVSKQSLVIGGGSRWNQVSSNPVGVNTNLENRKPLFEDLYELTSPGREDNHFQTVLPKASPELSISSKEDIPKTESLHSILTVNTNDEVV